MQIIIILLFVVLSISDSSASVLYKTPALFPPSPETIIVSWTDRVNGDGAKEFQEALVAFKGGNYELALDQFVQFTMDGRNSEVSAVSSLYAGSIYRWLALRDGRKNEKVMMNALRSFQFGLRLCPAREKGKIPEILLETGNIYLDLNLIAEAKGNFRRVIEDYPSTLFAARAQYMLAVINLKLGNFKDALSDLDVLMLRYNGKMEKERVFLAAELLFLLNEFGDARKYFEEGLRRWPAYMKGNPEILHEYSECQFQNGEIIKAREGFLTFYNLYPKDGQAGLALKRAAETFAISRNYPVAEKIFRDVIMYFPDSDDSFSSMLALGDMKLQSNREARSSRGRPAIPADKFNQDTLKYYKDVETASENNVLVATARFKTAKVMEEQGRLQQSFNVYLELINNPDSNLRSEVSEALSDAIDRIGIKIRDRLDRGDKAGVLKLYHAFYRDNLRYVKNEGLLMGIAAMHEGLHFYNDAHVIYEAIIERNGSRREQALFNAGKLYALSGDDRKAVGLLGRLLSEFPDGSMTNEARALAGNSFYNLKEYEKASNNLYAVIRDAPYRYPDAYIKLATMLQNRTQYEDSIAVLRDMLTGVRKQPNAGFASNGYVMLGNAYYGLQKYQEAMDAYNAGLKGGWLKEGSDTVEFMIGDCLLRLGRAEDAKKVFSKLSGGNNNLVKQISEERIKDIAYASGQLN
ncbi:MAG: tetratricopeptide repeat protein [Nitrospirae bacterium]|nr:tetratricopeptide repeat protein [Nitrospirota bacterium]